MHVQNHTSPLSILAPVNFFCFLDISSSIEMGSHGEGSQFFTCDSVFQR